VPLSAGAGHATVQMDNKESILENQASEFQQRFSSTEKDIMTAKSVPKSRYLMIGSSLQKSLNQL
jgi:hypothetical protein